MARPIKILWTSNVVVPAVAEKLGLPKSPFGGWLSITPHRLAQQPDVRVGVAMRAPVKAMTRMEIDGIVYYAMSQMRRDQYDVRQRDCDTVLADFAPDVLHAEGTEMAYTRRFLRSWRGARLISLQGVINGYAPYHFGRLPLAAMLNPLQPQRLASAIALIANERLRFRPRLAAERETFSLADHIVGRTLWDRAQANKLNPGAQYHHCPRMLRAPFYRRAWRVEACERHTLFVGNGASALKGAHIALLALAQLRRRFPDATLIIAGRDPRRLPVLSPNALFGYPTYMLTLIRRLSLGDAVTFTGNLDADAFAERMNRSHVALLPSLIENSPNTLAEAMLMGVPTVSAYTGGVPSMARDEDEVLLYRADDPAMLAFQVQRLFEDDALCRRLSEASRCRAQQTHDPDAIVDTLMGVYGRVLETADR